jgi:hypothetical protein
MKYWRSLIAVLCVSIAGLALYLLLKPHARKAQVVKIQTTPSPVPTQTVPPSAGRPTPVSAGVSNPNEPIKNEPDQNAILAMAKELLKPISFWGKVVDEKGSPVTGANVEWAANNNPDPYGTGNKGDAVSDSDGMFSVQSQGIGLYVKVSHPAYYEVPTRMRGKRGSSGGFSNADKLGNTDSPMGTRDNPAIFVLRKKGETVSLIRAENFVRVSRNGSPTEITLATAQPASGGDLKVEAWTNDQAKNAAGRYDWRCRLSVRNGGLIERKDRFDFEAPVDGYKPFDEINMPQVAEQWRPQESREYFVKLADGRYARIRFEMVAGGDNFFSINSYLNPTPGNRNLEFDPNKPVRH